MNAPIVFFVYNRPEHTKKTLVSLQKNTLAKNSHLYIFSDGPKTEKDIPKVNEVRQLVKNINGFKTVTVIERKSNWGLAKSIIEGVTEIINLHGRVIVLEDDLVTNPNFLSYMNTNLDFYQKNDNVSCISGYVYPIENLPENFFIRGSDCWGWATWKRAWTKFEPDGTLLYKELKKRKLLRLFNFNHTTSYNKMLIDQINGKNDSWAIRWYASTFLNNMYCLYPGNSLVINIGMDGSGTHCSISENFSSTLDFVPKLCKEKSVKEDEIVRKQFEGFFRSLNEGFFTKIKRKLKLQF